MTVQAPVRLAEPRDLPRLRSLEAQCFDTPWSDDALAEELAHERARALVIGEDGVDPEAIVGYVLVRYLLDEAEVLRLAIAPEKRRRGLAHQLLKAVLTQLADHGVEHCWLEVRSDNHGAIAFYKILGFTAAGRRKAYYRDGTDALLLQRPLPIPDEHCPTSQPGAKLDTTK